MSGWSPGVVLPGHGAYFLGPAPVLLAFGLGVTAVAVPLPADPALAGASFPIQAAIGGPLTFQTTNPEVVVVRP